MTTEQTETLRHYQQLAIQAEWDNLRWVQPNKARFWVDADYRATMAEMDELCGQAFALSR